VDGADRGQFVEAPLQEGLEDRLGTVVAQVAPRGQLLPQVHDQVLDVGRGALRGLRDRRLILPAGAVQSLASCLLDPVVDRRLRDAEAAGGLALGQAAADGLDDLATTLSGQAFLPMATSRRNSAFIKVTS
jgi:hypothetical protein